MSTITIRAGSETLELPANVSHVEVTIAGVRLSLTPAQEGGVDVRIISRPSAAMLVQPRAGNAIRIVEA